MFHRGLDLGLDICNDRVRVYDRGDIYRKCQERRLFTVLDWESPVCRCVWKASALASGQDFGHHDVFQLVWVCCRDEDISDVDGASVQAVHGGGLRRDGYKIRLLSQRFDK